MPPRYLIEIKFYKPVTEQDLGGFDAIPHLMLLIREPMKATGIGKQRYDVIINFCLQHISEPNSFW